MARHAMRWLIYAMPLIIFLSFFFLDKISDCLLAGYNILLAYLSFELSVKLCRKALQNQMQENIFFIPNEVYRNLKTLFLLCYATSRFFLDNDVSGFLAVSIGLIFIADLREFHYSELFKLPVIVFYLSQALGGSAYLLSGYYQLTNQADNPAQYAIFALFTLPITALYLHHEKREKF